MGEEKMSKLSLLSLLGNLIPNFLWEISIIDRMKTITSDRCNTHML